MFDLHTHILYGVDDGAKTLEDALAMAEVAARAGTRVMLATPHSRDVQEKGLHSEVRSRLQVLNQEIQRREIPLEVVLGMENLLEPALPDKVKQGLAFSMNSSPYILVEVPFDLLPLFMEETLFRLQVMGLTPVLAHPERSSAVQRDATVIERLVERGIVTQATAMSFTGRFGSRAKGCAEDLLLRNLVHVLASDTHFAEGHRSPLVTEGVAAVAKLVGSDRAAAMVGSVPEAILSGMKLEVPPPCPPPRRHLWKFWV